MGLSHSPSIVRNGLVLHLDAANVKSYPGSGTAWNDLSGLGNNGTLVNGVGYSAANNGTLVFDGVNDYVNTGYDLSWNNTNSVTISLVLKPANISTNFPFLGKGPVNWEWQLNQSSTSLQFTYWNTAGGHTNGPRPTLSNVFLNTTDYIYLVVVWSHAANQYYFYKNSVLLSTVDWIDASINQNRTDPIHAGGNIYTGGTSGNYWNGEIPVIQLYNRTLSQLEITQNFEALRGRYGI